MEKKRSYGHDPSYTTSMQKWKKKWKEHPILTFFLLPIHYLHLWWDSLTIMFKYFIPAILHLWLTLVYTVFALFWLPLSPLFGWIKAGNRENNYGFRLFFLVGFLEAVLNHLGIIPTTISIGKDINQWLGRLLNPIFEPILTYFTTHRNFPVSVIVIGTALLIWILTFLISGICSNVFCMILGVLAFLFGLGSVMMDPMKVLYFDEIWIPFKNCICHFVESYISLFHFLLLICPIVNVFYSDYDTYQNQFQ